MNSPLILVKKKNILQFAYTLVCVGETFLLLLQLLLLLLYTDI